MKRYWLFHFDHYYASGGMDDFVRDYDDPDEAMAFGNSLMYERSHGRHRWSDAHVVDSTNGTRMECTCEAKA